MNVFSALQKITAQALNANFAELQSGVANTANNSLQTFRDESFDDFVASGLILSAGAGLTLNISAGVVYINGTRYSINASTLTLTASKDCYIDVDIDGGTYKVEVTIGATTGMTLPANRKRLGYVLTGASTISKIYQIGFDPLGTRYYNTVISYNHHRTHATFADGVDATAVQYEFRRPADALTIGGKTVRIQLLTRHNATGVVAFYRTAYWLKYNVAFATLETSGSSVGDTASYQLITAVASGAVGEQYWCNYDMSSFDRRDVLRIDFRRDGAGGADTSTNVFEIELIEIWYNRDYSKRV